MKRVKDRDGDASLVAHGQPERMQVQRRGQPVWEMGLLWWTGVIPPPGPHRLWRRLLGVVEGQAATESYSRLLKLPLAVRRSSHMVALVVGFHMSKAPCGCGRCYCSP